MKPIFRWAGGKQKLTKTLVELLPSDFESRKYIEPFLGAGSLFLSSNPVDAVVSDINQSLIDTYLSIKKNPSIVSKYLNVLIDSDSEENYYKTRQIFNSSRPSYEQSARFIYLNRTCFNGVFRVNQKGHFNVPYAFLKNAIFPALSDLVALSNKLEHTKILCDDYSLALTHACPCSFVFLDPPYLPRSKTSFFRHYDRMVFSIEDHVRLAQLVVDLDKIGCKFIMTSSDHKQVRKLYSSFSISKITVQRYVSGSKTKTKVPELIIVNY